LIIENGVKHRVELIYIAFDNISFDILGQENLKKIHLKISSMQINNQIEHNVTYPVIMSPYASKKKERQRRYFLEIALSLRTDITQVIPPFKTTFSFN
jgi:hypothetical protein